MTCFRKGENWQRFSILTTKCRYQRRQDHVLSGLLAEMKKENGEKGSRTTKNFEEKRKNRIKKSPKDGVALHN